MSSWFGGGDVESQSAFDEFGASCSLSRKQRLYGFGGCFVGGMLLSLLGSILLFFGNISGFAVCYSIGNIVSLMSTGFLVGPWNQIKKMFDETRVMATAVFLITLVITLIVAFTIGKNPGGAILVFVCVGIQFVALMWYSLSYIPFGRATVKTALTSCFK